MMATNKFKEMYAVIYKEISILWLENPTTWNIPKSIESTTIHK